VLATIRKDAKALLLRSTYRVELPSGITVTGAERVRSSPCCAGRGVRRRLPLGPSRIHFDFTDPRDRPVLAVEHPLAREDGRASGGRGSTAVGVASATRSPRRGRGTARGGEGDAMWGLQSPIVGRERELGAVRQFVNDVNDGPASFVLEGLAGIGKTAWGGSTASSASGRVPNWRGADRRDRPRGQSCVVPRTRVRRAACSVLAMTSPRISAPDGAASVYLVERYLPVTALDGLAASVARVARLCADPEQAGTGVEYVHSTYLPTEDTWFLPVPRTLLRGRRRDQQRGRLLSGPRHRRSPALLRTARHLRLRAPAPGKPSNPVPRGDTER
jgi:hypothetical protein